MNTIYSNIASDSELLGRYVLANCSDAYAALVERYLPLIYSAALRQTRESHLAEDVAQATLIIFSQKAGRIEPAMLPGWLLKTTHYAARNAIRQRSRRTDHERRAAAMKKESYTVNIPSDADVVVGVIDLALARLRDADRTAIVLRYFQNKSFADIASHLQTTESAVQRRITRAVARLRSILLRQGVSISPAALPAALVSQALHPVPQSLALNAISPSASGNAFTSLVAEGVAHTMTTIKLKMTVAVVASVLLLGGATVAVHHFVAAPAQFAPSLPPPTDRAIAQDENAQFEEIYGLKGEVIRRIPPPFSFVRAGFLSRERFEPTNHDPDVVGAMTVKWKAGKPTLWGYVKTRVPVPYKLVTLISNLHMTRGWEVEGDQALLDLPLEGDIVVDGEATTEQYRTAIEKIASEAAGKEIRLEWRDVERPVIVLKGNWKYSPPAGRPPSSPSDGVPMLELYVATLRPGDGGEGDLQDTASVVSDYIEQPVFHYCPVKH